MTTRAIIRRILFVSCFCVGSWLVSSTAAPADDDVLPAADEPVKAPSTSRKVVMKTLGGRQFWGDVHHFRGWRIQKNVITGHHRLLDPDDFRHASGSRGECVARLSEVKREQNLKPMSGKAVVLVHGIVRSSKSFSTMAERLKKAGYTVVGFDYPSTRVGIDESARNLDTVIESLDGIEEINFVVHSMGGLVVRAYLAEHGDERINRMVMLGVPNRGANLADRLRKNSLYRLVYGPAGQQLGSDPDGLIARLPTPKFEFAIIAGGRGNQIGFNPLVPGDDDATVSVTSARLPGAADFLLVRCIHSFLMRHEDSMEATVRFLETGRLRKEGEPHPIPLPPENDDARPASADLSSP